MDRSTVERLQAALTQAYRVVDQRAPGPMKLVLRTLRPRLERSLAAEPERVVAILTWAWARIPGLVQDAVDLRDVERVQAIAAMVELREFGEDAPPAPEPAESPADPAPTDAAS